ncbi:Rok-like winged helix domain-containing protein [Bacillus sp. SD088]|uniref:Rok-like winged helix domain-containing protein n=1 Tax=Bacillus sp. SD088 TaxID=2782012 RepID=UPI001A9646C4|nr:competence protein ComK [Bacillus sp. SD088]MBO0995131.1 competence protein ComK [Bacillus sp. SD088]
MLFDERNALKIRLEQMNDVEKRILEDLHEERSFIFNRLRELDEQDPAEHLSDEKQLKKNNPIFSQADDATTTPAPIPRKRKGRPSRRSKTTKLREIAIEVLKEANAPVRGKELKEKIETASDSNIANMTTFMNTIRETDHHIIKVGRGLYVYDWEQQEQQN